MMRTALVVTAMISLVFPIAVRRVVDGFETSAVERARLSPDGKRLATFNSVWRREKDGSWKIVFDRGGP